MPYAKIPRYFFFLVFIWEYWDTDVLFLKWFVFFLVFNFFFVNLVGSLGRPKVKIPSTFEKLKKNYELLLKL